MIVGVIMNVEKYQVEQHNSDFRAAHQKKFDFISSEKEDMKEAIKKLANFQIAIPSWGLGTGGTRFGRFSGGEEPRTFTVH